VSNPPKPTPTQPARIMYQGVTWRLAFVKTARRHCRCGCAALLDAGTPVYRPIMTAAASLAGLHYTDRLRAECALRVGAPA
jgi:hypothetical protein